MIGDLLHFVEQVRREQHGAAFVGDGPDDGAEDVAAHDGIEAGRRLVEDQQLRPVRQGDQQPRPRLLALGQGLDVRGGVERERPAAAPRRRRRPSRG